MSTVGKIELNFIFVIWLSLFEGTTYYGHRIKPFNYALPPEGDSLIRVVQVNRDGMMTISGPDKMTGYRSPIAQPHRDCTNVTARNSHAA